MSFTQFQRCKPLAGIWGSQRPAETSKHDFNSYDLPPLIIPASSDYGSLPSSPSSPKSFASFSSASSSGSPVALPSASLYNKRDIWGSASFQIETEPTDNINNFYLTPLNDMYDRVSLDSNKMGYHSMNITPSTPTTTTPISGYSNNQVYPKQYIVPKPEYYNSVNSLTAYAESSIDSIPSTPVSSISSFSLTSSPITPLESPVSSLHISCNHSNTVNTINTSHTHNITPATNNNNRKKSKKSDSRLSKKKLPVNTELYKTEMCASFMKSGGFCPYGDKCQFAHGSRELKSVDRPSNWRSKPCQNWIKTGTCAYNERCCFRHD